MNLMKMMCGTLLLFTLASNVWGNPLNNLLYHAAENGNITVEWRFASTPGISIPSLKIHCVHLPDLKVFFQLDSSVKEDLDEHFLGRVQCDEAALTTGRVILHLYRVRTEDSGKYLCRMATPLGRKVKEFDLNIVRATKEPRMASEPPKPTDGRGRTILFVGLGLVAVAVAALAVPRCLIC